ncbi:C45 family autoproteolytic acyltransferase/hydolase [Endozoicomonas ascidiicola]|uniref:C45 family autoproteolytic acyltransferase/hydolase n=1 Tax=Endozoicomonas ascidiicola TaxID=1698521 RepID=UPI0008312C6B|nr:C45 family peptidase [Endozoicomonas ascidiicola]
MKKLFLNGSPRERGLVHGEQMRDEIKVALDYYRSRFLTDRSTLQNHVDQLLKPLQSFKPDYLAEMDAIAEASGIDPFWIYCINARSELMSSPTECSSIAFPQKGIIGQNWDWAEALAGQLALAEIELESGHRILTMTEPGMLAKIGMNSAGLGVCLNILPANQRLSGLPVHFLLRALLECENLKQAEDMIRQHGAGKASHITVADRQAAIGVELAPDQPWFQMTDLPVYTHTNHYLQPDQAQPTSSAPCTKARLEKLRKNSGDSELTIETMKQLLNDNEKPFPILKPYSDHELTGSGGTLVTMILDLNKRQMALREGFNPEAEFEYHTFST